MTVRNIAPGLAAGTTVAFAGLCRPHYTSSVLKTTVEKHGGLKVGTDLNFYYLPPVWAGERIQEFKEKPKVLAGFGTLLSNTSQEGRWRVFATLSMACRVEMAEAAGLSSAVSREAARAHA